VVDGLRTQRLDRPYIRENGKLRAASWPEAFAVIAAKAGRVDGKRVGAIAGIEQADALLIVGANPRKEAAVLNARIRKRWRAGMLKIGVIGPRADLTY